MRKTLSHNDSVIKIFDQKGNTLFSFLSYINKIEEHYQAIILGAIDEGPLV